MTALYLAGPMSGYPDRNYPAFHDAEWVLAGAGYDVLNPARNPEEQSQADYMRAAIRQVLDADGVAVLPDWQLSVGACLEVHIAHTLRVPVHHVPLWVARAGGAS